MADYQRYTPQCVLITGATGGFGKAFARRFAAAGCALILHGRDSDKLDKLCETIDAPVHKLLFDLQDKEETIKALHTLPEAFKNIDLLINNAGGALGLEKFQDANKRISNEHIQSICHRTDGHPFYTQHLCHALWELCEENTSVTDDLIENAVQTLLERESYAYTALWESFSLNQRRFLKGLANELGIVKPFASDFIRRYRLRSASNIQRVLESLLDKDVVDRDNGSFIITDRFFRIWIQKIQAGEGNF